MSFILWTSIGGLVGAGTGAGLYKMSELMKKNENNDSQEVNISDDNVEIVPKQFKHIIKDNDLNQIISDLAGLRVFDKSIYMSLCESINNVEKLNEYIETNGNSNVAILKANRMTSNIKDILHFLEDTMEGAHRQAFDDNKSKLNHYIGDRLQNIMQM